MRPTMRDIAQRAGVSKTTVSFALNDPSRISEETRKRVLAVVEELGYVPDPVARTLTTKRIGALGLLLPQPIREAFRNPYLCEIIRGIGEVCESRELSLVMLPPVGGRIIEAARRAFVDGLITIGIGPGHEVVGLLHRRRLPFVTIDGQATDATLNVGIDDEGAGYELMRYLLALGHRRITVLALRPEIINPPASRGSLVRARRLAGFTRALAEVGLSLESPGISVVTAEGSVEGGAAVAREILSKEEPGPTAIAAMADVVALGVCDACRSLGRAVPAELSVAGFDDIPLASRAFPSLTTVRQPGREKGSTAASLVVDLIGGSRGSHSCLETELVIRGSTAAPRS